VEVLLREQDANLRFLLFAQRKSDWSADASGARSQAPFSLPKRALGKAI